MCGVSGNCQHWWTMTYCQQFWTGNGVKAERKHSCYQTHSLSMLAHWGKHKMAAIIQMKISSLKMFEFVSIFHQILFMWVQSDLMTIQIYSGGTISTMSFTRWPLEFGIRGTQQGKSEGFDSCDRPSNLVKILSKSSIFQPMWPWNLIWWMTSKNNRAPLLYYIELCASFQIQRWIQTKVTVRKRSIRVKIFCPVWSSNLTDGLGKQ